MQAAGARDGDVTSSRLSVAAAAAIDDVRVLQSARCRLGSFTSSPR